MSVQLQGKVIKFVESNAEGNYGYIKVEGEEVLEEYGDDEFYFFGVDLSKGDVVTFTPEMDEDEKWTASNITKV